MCAKWMLSCFAPALVREILGLGSLGVVLSSMLPVLCLSLALDVTVKKDGEVSLFRQPNWKSELGMASRKTDGRRPDRRERSYHGEKYDGFQKSHQTMPLETLIFRLSSSRVLPSSQYKCDCYCPNYPNLSAKCRTHLKLFLC